MAPTKLRWQASLVLFLVGQLSCCAPLADPWALDIPLSAKKQRCTGAVHAVIRSLRSGLHAGLRGGSGMTPPLRPNLQQEDEEVTEELFGSETTVYHGDTEQGAEEDTGEDREESGLASARSFIPGVSERRRIGGKSVELENRRWRTGDHSESRRSLPPQSSVRGGTARESKGLMPDLASSRAFGVDSPETLRRISRQTDAKIEQIERILADRSQEWTKRVKALQELQAILAPSYHLQSEQFESKTAIFLKLVPGLCAQLGDKRSQLVKEVCKTIAFCADTLGQGFHRAAQKVTQSLLHLTYVTVRVISSSAAACLKTLVGILPLPLFLSEIEAALRDDHVQLRTCCAGFLLQVLRERAPEDLAGHEAVLSSILVKSLNDPSVSVRNLGKEAFKDFALCFPSEARNSVLWKVTGGMKTQLTLSLNEVGVQTYASEVRSPAMKSADFRAFRRSQAQQPSDAFAHGTPAHSHFASARGDDDELDSLASPRGRFLSGPPLRVLVAEDKRDTTPLYADTPAHRFLTTPAKPRTDTAPSRLDADAAPEESEDDEAAGQGHSTQGRQTAQGSDSVRGLADPRGRTGPDTEAGSQSVVRFFMPSAEGESEGAARKTSASQVPARADAVSCRAAPSHKDRHPAGVQEGASKVSSGSVRGQGTMGARVGVSDWDALVPAAVTECSGNVQAAVQGMGTMEPSSEVVGDIKVVDFRAEAKLSATCSPVRKRWEKRPPGRFARGGGPSPPRAEDRDQAVVWHVGSSAQRMVPRAHARVSTPAQGKGTHSKGSVMVSQQRQRQPWSQEQLRSLSGTDLGLLDGLLSDCASFLTKQGPVGLLANQSSVERGATAISATTCTTCNDLRSMVANIQAQLGMLWLSLSLGRCLGALDVDGRGAGGRGAGEGRTDPSEVSQGGKTERGQTWDAPGERMVQEGGRADGSGGDIKESPGGTGVQSKYEEERRQRILQNVKKMAALGLNKAEKEEQSTASDEEGSWEEYSEESTEEEEDLNSDDQEEVLRSSRRRTQSSRKAVSKADEGHAASETDDDGSWEEESEEEGDDEDWNSSQLTDAEESLSAPLSAGDSGGAQRQVGQGRAKPSRFVPPWGRDDHPSTVDPTQPGLTRMQRFRAEVVQAVYDSDGTSEAQALMGSSVPSFMEDAFAEAGWEADKPEQREQDGRRGRAGGGKANSALTQGAGEMEDSEEVMVSCEGTGSEDTEGGTGAKDVSGEGPGGSSCSSSLSAARKRLRDLTWDSREERESRSGECDQKKSKAAPRAQKRGEYCRRPGVKGRYYEVQNKYLCNNCGLAGHVKRTCPHPARLLDSSLERVGWQVSEVSRKNGAAVEKYYVPPDKSTQLRGLTALQAYLESQHMQLSDFVADHCSISTSSGGKQAGGEAGVGKSKDEQNAKSVDVQGGSKKGERSKDEKEIAPAEKEKGAKRRQGTGGKRTVDVAATSKGAHAIQA